jgi:ABC-type phosphate/phosphonate transport system substrate-binding protein
MFAVPWGEATMVPHQALFRQLLPGFVLLAAVLAPLLTLIGPAANGEGRIDVLRIGASGTLTGEADGSKEKAGVATLHRFIREETGMDNEILGRLDWRDLADRMAKRQLHLGVFQGYEFAWAREKHPALAPLAVAVNVDRYPVAYVVTRRRSPAADFAGLQGQSVSLPATSLAFLRLFLARQSEACGKKPDAFFSTMTAPDNVEDALDDVVDGKVGATVVDRVALAAYKRRKPGRFNQLKVLARSQPFPPAVVAYYGSAVDQTTLGRFRDGLLGAHRKPKGETLLTLCRLTGFEPVPDDFPRALEATRKAYPPAGPGE